MQEVACLLCNNSGHPVVISQDGFTGKNCEQCEVIYISPRPDRQQVADIYGHTQAHIAAQSHVTDSWFKQLHARHTLRILQRYMPSGDLLEIGAGGGFFLAQAQRVGFTPYAIELNPVQAQFMAEQFGIPCERQPLSRQSFGNRLFDAIYHCDVISHFFDPVEDFKIMHGKLKAGGIVMFETGNIAEVDQRHFGKFPSFQYPDHLFFFGERSIRTILELTGFELRLIQRSNIEGHLALQRLTKKESQPGHGSAQAPKNSRFKNIARTLYHGACFASRYQLGRLVPSTQRPQTLIVVAQKI